MDQSFALDPESYIFHPLHIVAGSKPSVEAAS